MADEDLDALGETVRPAADNFRTVAQIYTDQISLIRRSQNAVNAALEKAGASGPSLLFDISADPLNQIRLDEIVVEQQIRVVDLLVLAALGQSIEIQEYQDYAKLLVPHYAAYNFAGLVKNSALKNEALRELEKEWQEGSDFTRVQDFFKNVVAAVQAAAEYCGITIDALPEF